MCSTLKYADLETEGCNIHYWYQGSGPLLLFVPGGNGHGRQCRCLLFISSLSHIPLNTLPIIPVLILSSYCPDVPVH